jgi:prepilin-type processing-associated H-X9-DG protein
MHRGVLKIVAIAIPVLFLLGIGLMAVMRAREYSQRMQCQYNLGQVGLFAMWSYMEPIELKGIPRAANDPNRWRALPPDFQPKADLEFPPGTQPNPKLPPEHRLSWEFILLPYLDRDELYARFDQSKAWDEEPNAIPAHQFVRFLACPSQFKKSEPALADYVGMAGIGMDAPRLPASDPRAGVFRYDGRTKLSDLARGLSNTLDIVETTRHLGPWAAGGPATVRGLDPNEGPLIGPNRPLGGHPTGANAAFADGSVRFLSLTIDPRVLERLSTLAVRGQE